MGQTNEVPVIMCGHCPAMKLQQYEDVNPYYPSKETFFRCTLLNRQIEWPYRDERPNDCPLTEQDEQELQNYIEPKVIL